MSCFPVTSPETGKLPTFYGLVADLLATQQTILTLWSTSPQPGRNKLATSLLSVVSL